MNDGLTVETIEQDGYTLRVRYDEYEGQDNNPRDWCNLGTMVCWHPDYYLGDYQVTNPEGRGAVEHSYHRDDFPNLNVLARYLTLAEGALLVLPLYLYDHSGISISVGRNPYTMDPQGWDTTMVGFIYTTAEQVEQVGCPLALDKLTEGLVGEVETYDAYLRGEVYYYIIEDADGEMVETATCSVPRWTCAPSLRRPTCLTCVVRRSRTRSYVSAWKGTGRDVLRQDRRRDRHPARACRPGRVPAPSGRDTGGRVRAGDHGGRPLV